MNKEQLALLVCPITKGKLIYNPETQELISKQIKLAFPIKDGIPIMLESEARKITQEEYDSIS